jgi:hypothetical protein
LPKAEWTQLITSLDEQLSNVMLEEFYQTVKKSSYKAACTVTSCACVGLQPPVRSFLALSSFDVCAHCKEAQVLCWHRSAQTTELALLERGWGCT